MITPKQALFAMLLGFLAAGTLLAFVCGHIWLGKWLGVEECLWSATLFYACLFFRTLRGKPVWKVGALVAACLTLAWLCYVTRYERAHRLLSHLATFVLYVSFISDIFKNHTKRLWKNIKGQVLTAVSAASIKRQIHDAFS